MKKILLPAILALLASSYAVAADLNLKIEHDITTVSPDGVTRNTRFNERLIRRDNQSWLARILPANSHADEAHQQAHKKHKHVDLAASSRWVIREQDGKLNVRVVNEHEKVTVAVTSVDYGNVGFDGKWSTASQLMDAEQIKRMKPTERKALAGARWHEANIGETKVQVLWNEREQYPHRIESANKSGSIRSAMTIKKEPMPAVMPWDKLNGYAAKDYADLLD